MLEYLDTVGCDSDFILKSDIDDTSEDASYVTPLAADPVSDSEEDDMDDEEILSPVQPLPHPF
jgi:hypothetical protein